MHKTLDFVRKDKYVSNTLRKHEMDAHYRKYNDHSHNSSTYHKKDGTPVRAILKRETKKLTKEA